MQASSANRGSAALKAILIAGAGVVAIAILVGGVLSFPTFIMPSGSMEKTLLIGDRIVVDRISTILGRPLRRGDVIALRYPINPVEIYLKRVVGIPGDRLRIRNKVLYRNGVEVREPYAQHVTSYMDAFRDNFPSTPNAPLLERAQDMLNNHVVNGELVVPTGKYFVMGDNRDDSFDSRYWGFIQPGDVIGRAIRIYASPDPSRVWKPVN
jgi:signal peptidase I